jgi:predicted transporter
MLAHSLHLLGSQHSSRDLQLYLESCSLLAGLADIDPWKTGALVGLLFFISIAAFSTILGRMQGSPFTLGNAMIFLGRF